jgi:hypothetical protein
VPLVAANNENLCAAASKLDIMLNMAARYHSSGSLKWFFLAPFRLSCTSNAPTALRVRCPERPPNHSIIILYPHKQGAGRPCMRTDQRASLRQGVPHDKNVDGGILKVRLQDISFRYCFNLTNMEPFLASISFVDAEARKLTLA